MTIVKFSNSEKGTSWGPFRGELDVEPWNRMAQLISFEGYCSNTKANVLRENENPNIQEFMQCDASLSSVVADPSATPQYQPYKFYCTWLNPPTAPAATLVPCVLMLDPRTNDGHFVHDHLRRTYGMESLPNGQVDIAQMILTIRPGASETGLLQVGCLDDWDYIRTLCQSLDVASGMAKFTLRTEVVPDEQDIIEYPLTSALHTFLNIKPNTGTPHQRRSEDCTDVQDVKSANAVTSGRLHIYNQHQEAR